MKQYLQNGVFRAIYALLTTLIILGILVFIMRGTITPELRDVTMVIVGALLGELKQTSSYYFGSSDKSISNIKEKDTNHIDK